MGKKKNEFTVRVVIERDGKAVSTVSVPYPFATLEKAQEVARRMAEAGESPYVGH